MYDADKSKLTDFEKLEYYKQRDKSRTTLIVVFSVMSFVLGLIVAQYFHK